MASAKKVYQVAVVIYDGADTLDFAGPIEILTHVYYNTDPQAPELAFKVHIVAETLTVRVGGALTITADMTFQEAGKRLDEFDILIVPGGPPARMMDLIAKDSPEIQWIRRFATQMSPDGSKGERLILSVCTGALLLGATAAVGGLTLTTHHLAYDLLRQVCEKAANGNNAAQVVGNNSLRRYVDGGNNASGVRIITAGGITCGLDASLYVAALKVGYKAAEDAAALTEHEWKKAV